MKPWLFFIASYIIITFLHEGTHIVMAIVFNEFQSLHLRSIGFEVTFMTPVNERVGIQWALISGTSSLLTTSLGYVLFYLSPKIAHSHHSSLRGIAYYLTILALLFDPFNLSVGPFLYGGDAHGVAVGFGIDVIFIQILFFIVLAYNRELIASRLFHTYNIRTSHFLFQPWVKRSRQSSTK